MMKFVLLFLFFICNAFIISAQELFPLNEPASNMPSKSLGVRLNQFIMPPFDDHNSISHSKNAMYRLNPELMWGINKSFMIHLNFYASNMHQENFRLEGSSIYLKHRFFSRDDVRKHFRLAYFIKTSIIDNPIRYNEINLGGDNSGLGVGIIATQLVHKFAGSFSGSYLKSFNNINNEINTNRTNNCLSYSLSSGYLLYPMKYKNFNQTNLNLYAEILGKYNPETKESFLDFAPAIQFIFKSVMRFDVGYRKQVKANMLRINDQEYFLKFEYNFFNALIKKNK